MTKANNFKLKVKSATIVVLSVLTPIGALQGCAVADMVAGTPQKTRYESFLDHYGRNVGRTIGPVRRAIGSPDKVIKLPNGNIEEEYILKNTKCHVYYEYPPETNLITTWRSEGGPNGCGYSPP